MKPLTRHIWRTSEERHLLKWYGVKPVAVIADELGITVSAIHNRVTVLRRRGHDLGAQGGKDHRRRICRDTIRRGILQGMRASQIAEALGIECSAVYRIVKKEFDQVLHTRMLKS